MGVASQSPHVPGKLRVEKVSEGSVDYVRIRGIIDQSFDGKKLSRALPGQKLIIDLKDTRRIASSGVQRWLEFLAGRDTANVYLVECAPHLISQLGMMSSLAGGAKVLSFYAPYRCHSCTQEFDVRYVVPRDRAAIVEFMPPQHPCAKCGSASDLDDDPHSFFSAIAKQALFDVDHDVTAFVR